MPLCREAEGEAPAVRRGDPRAGGGLALVLLAILVSAAPARAERAIGYLYVEANEGGSSGGHVAVRFADETFHFQHESPGVLRLHRDDASDFLFRYTLLQNRQVRESRIAVSDQTFDLLRDAFSRRALIQAAQFDALRGLRADAELFQSMAAPSSDQDLVALPGFGYFERDPAARDGSAALRGLRACVAETHGAGFLAIRAARATASLEALRPGEYDTEVAAIRADRYPVFPPSFSSRWADLLAGREAAEILASAPSLDRRAYRELDDAALTVDEERALRLFSQRLAAELCRLAASPRPDWGTSMAMGMARLEASELSMARGHWVLLDPYPLDAAVAVLPDGEMRDEYLAVLEAESAVDLEIARHELAAPGGCSDAVYSTLEAAGNRAMEARSARAGGPLRLGRELLVPSREASVGATRPVWAPGQASYYAIEARRAAERLSAELEARYRYDLVRRNCVSEIFATIDEGFASLPEVGSSADPSEAIRAESMRRLGGYVHTGFDANFIPLASEAAIDAHYDVVERQVFPSYRERRLAALEGADSPWRMWARESNTWTSATYRPGEGDSTFLFFADGPLVLRPVLGAANLVYALGAGAVGLAALPVAGPGRLDRGLRGALYSVPELAFVNLRKGTTSFVERRWAGPELR